MRPITEVNTLPHKPFMGWQTRLDEIQAANDATAKDSACHHFSRALDQKIPAIRRALIEHSRFVQMPEKELKMVPDLAHDAEVCVFGSCLIMDRLDPGIAAVKKCAGGILHVEQVKTREEIWHVLKKIETVQQRHFSRAIPSTERRRIDLTIEMWPLVDDLEKRIREFYTAAQRRYNLPDLNGGAK